MAAEKMIRGDETNIKIFLIYMGLELVITTSVRT
jgi:hypothetical protein